MSQENAEIVRQSYEAFNEHGVAGVIEFWDPEIVWYTDPHVPEPGVYTGVQAVRQYLEGFEQAFGEVHIDMQRLIDVGGEEVFAVLTVKGHPLGQTDQQAEFFDWAWIATVREGKLVRIRSFLDHARGREAAGLTE